MMYKSCTWRHKTCKWLHVHEDRTKYKGKTSQNENRLVKTRFGTSSRRPRHPQAERGLSLCATGTSLSWSRRRFTFTVAVSSPLARLPLGQGTDSEQTPSSYTVWVVGFDVPTQLARKHSIKIWSMVNLCRFCACWMLDAGAWCCLTTGITTVLPTY